MKWFWDHIGLLVLLAASYSLCVMAWRPATHHAKLPCRIARIVSPGENRCQADMSGSAKMVK